MILEIPGGAMAPLAPPFVQALVHIQYLCFATKEALSSELRIDLGQ